MRRLRKGFTLIEVSLFLAITGLLFLSVTVGVQNSIYQQRYNDVVQSFADFMRNMYDEIYNVQSISNGRHEKAIYGKLITFGETEGKQTFYGYDVIAKAVISGDISGGTTLGLLSQLGANVVFRENEEQPYHMVGIIDEYTPNWGAKIQPTTSFNDFKGSLLIVRDPKSGTVRTFLKDDVIEVRKRVDNTSDLETLLTAAINNGEFHSIASTGLDFCVNPDGDVENHNRTDIRLLAGISNASGVTVISRDDTSEGGNRCNQ